jgi:hypothetical protein
VYSLAHHPKGTENSLVAKLESAKKSLKQGNQSATVNKCEAFINEVDAQNGKKLTDAQASTLIASAKEIITAIQGGR